MELENYRRRLPEVVAGDGVEKITEFSIVGGCTLSRERSDIWGLTERFWDLPSSFFVLEGGIFGRRGKMSWSLVEIF